jgi:hypothetical protein
MNILFEIFIFYVILKMYQQEISIIKSIKRIENNLNDLFNKTNSNIIYKNNNDEIILLSQGTYVTFQAPETPPSQGNQGST